MSSEFIKSLPHPEDGQFIIPLNDEESQEVNALVCVRELTWFEAANIEYTKYRVENGKDKYFNGEAERRETLRKVIVWVADLHEELFVDATTSNVLSLMDANTLEVVWNEYARITTVSGIEQATLYDSAVRFFSGTAAGSGPVHPMVLIVDAMDKGICTMSVDEFKNITNSEHERMMICLKAKQQMLDSEKTKVTVTSQSSQVDTRNYPPGFFPPGVHP
jgi:hypothetical protein